MDDRRADARLLCADVVEVRWTNAGGKICQATALLEDIARHGACLQLDKAVPPQTAITIKHATGEMHGIVRYCVFREIGYFVGIQFEPDSRWSRNRFTPQHLLDLEELLKQRLNQRNPTIRSAEKRQ